MRSLGRPHAFLQRSLVALPLLAAPHVLGVEQPLLIEDPLPRGAVRLDLASHGLELLLATGQLRERLDQLHIRQVRVVRHLPGGTPDGNATSASAQRARKRRLGHGRAQGCATGIASILSAPSGLKRLTQTLQLPAKRSDVAGKSRVRMHSRRHLRRCGRVELRERHLGRGPRLQSLAQSLQHRRQLIGYRLRTRLARFGRRRARLSARRHGLPLSRFNACELVRDRIAEGRVFRSICIALGDRGAELLKSSPLLCRGGGERDLELAHTRGVLTVRLIARAPLGVAKAVAEDLDLALERGNAQRLALLRTLVLVTQRVGVLVEQLKLSGAEAQAGRFHALPLGAESQLNLQRPPLVLEVPNLLLQLLAERPELLQLDLRRSPEPSDVQGLLLWEASAMPQHAILLEEIFHLFTALVEGSDG